MAKHPGKLTKAEVLAGRGDLSPFLVHLTRTGSVKLWSDIYKDLGSNDVRIIDAKTCLERIIEKSVVKAISPFGYFQYKVPLARHGRPVKNEYSKVQRSWLRSVCLTETPIDHVHFQMSPIEGRNLAFQPYGLAFWESSIRRCGGNPIFYFDTKNTNLTKSLDDLAISAECENQKSLLPLYQSFGPRFDGKSGEIDFRWEREWRVVGDLNFTSKDIAFGICDQVDIEHFENLVNHEYPFVDPRADIDEVKARLRPHMPQLKL